MLLRADAESREWLEELLYFMLEDPALSHYCYTFHNMEVIAVNQPFAFSGALPVPAAVTLDPKTRRFLMLLYYPLLSRLTFRANLAILQHEAGHVLEGHLTSQGQALKEKYGWLIANIAQDCYVNQKIDVTSLTEVGLVPATVAEYGLPSGLSSLEYAELLDKLPPEKRPQKVPVFIVRSDGVVVDENGNPVDSTNVPQDPQAGASGTPQEDFTGKGQARMSEVADIQLEEMPEADEATNNVVDSVKESLKAAGVDNNKVRGLFGADHDSFIKATKRDAVVPWSTHIRRMESYHRQTFVVPTRRRPSRRHPAHLGRVRRFGLECLFMVDTSGSMGQEELSLVDPELRALHYRGTDIQVIHCDAQVARVERYSPFTPLERFYGRGGTDFSPVFEYVRTMPRPARFMVCYTDGMGSVGNYVEQVCEERGDSWYEQFIAERPTHSPDGMEILWLIPQGCMSVEEFQSRICPWGTVVIVSRN